MQCVIAAAAAATQVTFGLLNILLNTLHKCQLLIRKNIRCGARVGGGGGGRGEDRPTLWILVTSRLQFLLLQSFVCSFSWVLPLLLLLFFRNNYLWTRHAMSARRDDTDLLEHHDNLQNSIWSDLLLWLPTYQLPSKYVAFFSSCARGARRSDGVNIIFGDHSLMCRSQ